MLFNSIFYLFLFEFYGPSRLLQNMYLRKSESCCIRRSCDSKKNHQAIYNQCFVVQLALKPTAVIEQLISGQYLQPLGHDGHWIFFRKRIFILKLSVKCFSSGSTLLDYNLFSFTCTCKTCFMRLLKLSFAETKTFIQKNR